MTERSADGRIENGEGDQMPLVSVVLPTYSRPQLLGRAIDSVRAQSHTNWELIVVDDNPPDSEARRETERFMERWSQDARVRYCKHDANKGGGAARNTGIRTAKGEYVAFLDDDDEWEPRKLEWQIQAFAGASDRVAMVYGGFRKVFHHSGRESLILPESARHQPDDLFRRNTIGTTSAIMCRRESLFEVGLFDESLPRRQDIDLYVRLAREHEFVAVPKVLLTWHRHEGPSIGGNRRSSIEGNRRFFEKHRHELEARPHAYSYRLVSLGRLLAREGDFEEARSAFLQAWRLRPGNLSPLARALFANRVGAGCARAFSSLRRSLASRMRRGSPVGR